MSSCTIRLVGGALLVAALSVVVSQAPAQARGKKGPGGMGGAQAGALQGGGGQFGGKKGMQLGMQQAGMQNGGGQNGMLQDEVLFLQNLAQQVAQGLLTADQVRAALQQRAALLQGIQQNMQNGQMRGFQNGQRGGGERFGMQGQKGGRKK